MNLNKPIEFDIIVDDNTDTNTDHNSLQIIDDYQDEYFKRQVITGRMGHSILPNHHNKSNRVKLSNSFIKEQTKLTFEKQYENILNDPTS